ncbi:Uncharacterised protein [Legionella busanensis]|uniref:Uncharacterized protein n=1 Tax=Legionella busanensis TaxID=190655 RepID=A0A378JM04_9GAMM|nr:hypothetical protein [Legionella busanensis]STX51771.1 Uncharacterised protein [Legionella busanensis]
MYETPELESTSSNITTLSTAFELNLIPTTAAGAIDLTKAERIAEGGTHILYRFPNAPFVIKLMKQNPAPEELAKLEEKYTVLYACFDKEGKQRCIREKHFTFLVQLPGKKAQIAALSIVPYEKCFTAKIKFDFKIEPSELDPYLIEHKQDFFEKISEYLIHPTDEIDFNLNDYALFDRRIGAILQRLDNDLELRQVMAEFLNHYRDFYKKTNIILDAMGYENILFFKDEQDNWQFKIGSVIKHDTGKYTNELFANLQAGKPVDLTNFFNFTHAYFSPANIRALNICAAKLSLEPVISDVSINTRELVNLSQQLSIPERMLAYAKHGDFTKVYSMLNDNKDNLSFSFIDYWAYSLIADEYIKHSQSPKALKNYFDIVSRLPILLPEKEDDQQRVQTAKEAMIDRKKIHDKKIQLHEEITNIFPKFSIWSLKINKPKDCQQVEKTTNALNPFK